MKKNFILLGLGLMMAVTGCKNVSIHVKNQDEDVHLAVPIFVLKQALKFSDDAVLEIDDLGGVDQEIDLGAIAKALRQDGQSVRFSMTRDGRTIDGRKIGNVFCVKIVGEEEKVTLNLPMALMEKLADLQDGEAVDSSALVASLAKFSGELMHVESPDETVSISIR